MRGRSLPCSSTDCIPCNRGVVCSPACSSHPFLWLVCDSISWWHSTDSSDLCWPPPRLPSLILSTVWSHFYSSGAESYGVSFLCGSWKTCGRRNVSVSGADRKLEFLGKGFSPTLVGMYFVTGKDCLVTGQQVHLPLGDCSLGWHKLCCVEKRS